MNHTTLLQYDKMGIPLINYKIANQYDEIEQIHQLNYKTFVEEIPQHNPNSAGILIDKFHTNNTYIIAKKENEVIGMVSVSDKRPFSLDYKLNDIGNYFKDINKMAEIRLLSIKRKYRKTKIFFGLIKKLYEYLIEKEYSVLIISAILRELKLYNHIGYVPFGPIVGTKEAPYQPMSLDIKKAYQYAQRFLNRNNV